MNRLLKASHAHNVACFLTDHVRHQLLYQYQKFDEGKATFGKEMFADEFITCR